MNILRPNIAIILKILCLSLSLMANASPIQPINKAVKNKLPNLIGFQNRQPKAKSAKTHEITNQNFISRFFINLQAPRLTSPILPFFQVSSSQALPFCLKAP